jgi:thiosulfate/3-mercaptopyruvate sulfurtransferase
MAGVDCERGLNKMLSKTLARAFGIAVLPAAACALLVFTATSIHADADPWTKAQTVLPADLVKELGNANSAPTVVCVGFKRLYSAAHIKGAQYHGTAGNDEGLKELAAWAAEIPRSANLVIYCGCCPMERCPNIRPAFKALQGLGFKNLRVLLLQQDFATDWVDKGFPYDKAN